MLEALHYYLNGDCSDGGETALKKREFEVDLSSDNVRDSLALSMKENPRDFLLFGFLTCSLRRSEIVGNHKGLPGIRAEDIWWKEGAVKILGKGQKQRAIMPIPDKILQSTKDYLGGKESGRLFDLSGERLAQITKRYAKMVGVSGWPEVHPHRWRHWFEATIPPLLKPGLDGLVESIDMMRHSRKPLGPTISVYYPTLSYERRREITLAALAKVLP